MQIGKYILLRKIATGGMAEVFLAKAAGPMGFEKVLVLKRILPHLAEDPAFVEMFLSEAKLAAQLNHHNIVQIFDFGEADGAYYLAMEYIEGPNLRVLSKRASRLGMDLSPALCARLISNACEGLAFAHDFADSQTGQPQGLVHRDISPDNILVSRQGAVKVVDFGIAKAVGQRHRTQTGTIKGKLAYMPPEQVRNKPLDRRADVYSLGVVFYELLTGRRPFDTEADASIMNAILFEPLVPAVERRPDLPEAVQRILERALAKHLEQRYPDCRAFQTDLEEFIASTGKPLGAYQLSQFVIQVTDGTDISVPPAKSPSHDAPTAQDTLGEGNLPSGMDGPTSARPITVSLRGIQATEPVTPSSIDAASALAAVAPNPSLDLGGTVLVEHAPPASLLRQGKRVTLAILSIALFVTAGGYLLAQTSTEPARQKLAAQSAKQPVPLALPVAPPSVVVSRTDTQAPPQSWGPSNSAAADVPLLASSLPASSPAPMLSAPEPRSSPKPKGPKGQSASEARSKLSKPLPPKPQASTPVILGKGTVRFRIVPYATVILDGKELGQTPLPKEFEVLAGEHSVTLVNEKLGKKITRHFDVNAGEAKIFKLNLLDD